MVIGSALAAFVAASVLLVTMTRLFSRMESGLGPFWLLVMGLVFGCLAAVMSRRYEDTNVAGAVGIYAGIAAGVVADIALGMAMGEPERTLWPLEIAFYWATAFVPVLLGIYVGRYSGRRGGTEHG